MTTANASHLSMLGCPPEHHAVLAGISLPALETMKAIGFSWPALAAFVSKWGATGKDALTAILTGGGAFVAFAILHRADLPAIIADLLAIFTAPVAVPDVIMP